MCESVLKYLPEEELVSRVRSAWAAIGSGAVRGPYRDMEVNKAKWKALTDLVQERVRGGGGQGGRGGEGQGRRG